MFVAATTASFPDLSFAAAMEKIVDLGFSSIEIGLVEGGPHLAPSAVAENMERAAALCRAPHRLTPSAYVIEPAPGEHYYEHFAACCRLAKATKVVTLVVRASELGTPFNEEVDRLKRLTAIALVEGARVGLKTESGCISEDPSTVKMLCENVKGLGVALDPSHFICGPNAGRSYEQLMPFVYHVQLRDTTSTELQVRIGQGDIEYGKLIQQLSDAKYDRALCVDILPVPEVDHDGEIRKLRLLLESLL